MGDLRLEHDNVHRATLTGGTNSNIFFSFILSNVFISSFANSFGFQRLTLKNVKIIPLTMNGLSSFDSRLVAVFGNNWKSDNHVSTRSMFMNSQSKAFVDDPRKVKKKTWKFNCWLCCTIDCRLVFAGQDECHTRFQPHRVKWSFDLFKVMSTF